jgi:hypothetical protein
MDQDKVERLELMVNNMGLLVECLKKELNELKSTEQSPELRSIRDPDYIFYPEDYDEVFEG